MINFPLAMCVQCLKWSILIGVWVDEINNINFIYTLLEFFFIKKRNINITESLMHLIYDSNILFVSVKNNRSVNAQ